MVSHHFDLPFLGFKVDFFCLEGACDSYLKDFADDIAMFNNIYKSEDFKFVTLLVSIVYVLYFTRMVGITGLEYVRSSCLSRAVHAIHLYCRVLDYL